MKTTTRNVLSLPLYASLSTGLLLCLAHGAGAQDTWTGTDSGNNNLTSWNDANNWSDAANAAPSPYDSLIFTGANVTNNNNFPNGIPFDGITFAGSAGRFNLSGNAILISGNATGNFNGVFNYATGVLQGVALNLTLDSGYYEFTDYGGGVGLNGTLTLGNNSVAYFNGTITSTSLTTDSTGLISGLDGQGLMYDGGSPVGQPVGLATISSGSIQAYTSFTTVASGGVASGNNIELTASGAAAAFTDSSATVNTITALQAGNSGGTATDTLTTTGTLTLGQRGGIYALNGGANKSLLTVTGGNLTAGTVAGATIVIGANGTTLGNSPPNMMTISSHITDNPGGSVSLVKVGSGSVVVVTNNTYSGGTYVLQGQVQTGNTNSLGTGPLYIAEGATVYLNSSTGNQTIPNNIFLSPGNGSSLWNGTGANPGGLVAFSSDGNSFFNGVITLMGAPVTVGTAGCRIIGNKDIGDICVFQNQIIGTGTLDFCTSPHADLFELANNPSNHLANNWQGGLIIEEVLAGPSSARNITVQLEFDNQIPSGTNAGNVMMYEADTSLLDSVVKLDLNGHNNTINALIASAAGSTLPVVGNFSSTSNSTLTIGANNASGTFQGALTDTSAAHNLSLVKIGTGTETINGPLTHHGSTTVNGGTLALSSGSSLPNSPVVTVASTATLDASGIGGLTVGSAQTLNCVGTILGNTTVNGIIQSLDAIGTFNNPGSLTLSGGGAYVWNINNATGTAGADPGTSLLNVGGTLQINATAGNPFNIDITSLGTNDSAGNAVNFNSGTSYSWVLAQTGGISGFTGSSQFNIVTSAFANHPNSSAQWSVSQSGNNLMLNFNGFQAITTQVTPSSETVNQGHNAVFSVTANSLGSGTTFTWSQDGNPLSNGGQSAGGAPGNVIISTSGNTSTLTIQAVDGAVENADEGIISVTVNTTYNGPQTAESSAILDVIDTPYNPNVVASQMIAPVTAGSVNVLSASANGTAPFTYQWYLNNSTIAGATNATFNVNISPGTTGNYTVLISNSAGDVTSSATDVTGPLSLVPNQILFEPFNYSDQTHNSSPPQPPWSAFGVTNIFNQATGAAVVWQNVGNNDFSTMPSYNLYDQYAPSPRSVVGDEYPVAGLAGDDANAIYADSDVNGGQVNLPFGTGGTIATGEIYFSAVIQLWGFDPNPDTTPDYLCGFDTGATNSTTHSFGLFVLPNEAGGDGGYPNIPYSFGIFKGNVTTAQLTTNGAWDPNQSLDYAIYFVVCRLNLNANGPGYSTCDLWVNPSTNSFYTNEADVPTPDVAGVAGNVPDTAGGISSFFMKITTYPVDRLFGDVRIGTTWASVTPPSAPALSLANQLLTNVASSTVVFASQNAGNLVNNYQWTFNNGHGAVTLSDGTLADNAVISGSSTGAMTITGATAAEEGSYTVTGMNSDPSPGGGGALYGSASALLTTVPPALSIANSATNVVLSWPTNWAVGVAMTTSLQQPTTWTPVAGGTSGFLEWPVGSGSLTWAPTASTGSNYTLTVPRSATDLYFRLVPSP